MGFVKNLLILGRAAREFNDTATNDNNANNDDDNDGCPMFLCIYDTHTNVIETLWCWQAGRQSY